MKKRHLGNVLIGQSGGPDRVINQSLVGIVETCLASARIGRISARCTASKACLTARSSTFAREEEHARSRRTDALRRAALRAQRSRGVRVEAILSV